MSEWQDVPLSSLGAIVTGGTPASQYGDSWGNDIDFLTPTDQRDGIRSPRPARRLSLAGARRMSNKVVPPGAVCFTCIGSTIGKVSLADRPTVTNQQINSIIPDGKVSDSEFIYYLLIYHAPNIAQIASGSATPIVNKSQFGRFRVAMPTLLTQRSIGRMLGTLDDKIAANERVAATIFELIQLAWASVVSNVVETVPFGQLATIDKGVSYKGAGLDSGLPLVNLANFGTDGRFKDSELKQYSGDTRDRHHVRPGDLVVANTDLTQRREILGQAALVEVVADKAIFSHHVYAVRPNSDTDRIWLYAALRDKAFRERAVTYASGTTVASLPRDALLNYEVPMPSPEVRGSWSDSARIQIEMASSHMRENRQLAVLRDTLLPRLMSGELRIRDAERLVSDEV